jgi:hypothetical protein
MQANLAGISSSDRTTQKRPYNRQDGLYVQGVVHDNSHLHIDHFEITHTTQGKSPKCLIMLVHTVATGRVVHTGKQ